MRDTLFARPRHYFGFASFHYAISAVSLRFDFAMPLRCPPTLPPLRHVIFADEDIRHIAPPLLFATPGCHAMLPHIADSLPAADTSVAIRRTALPAPRRDAQRAPAHMLMLPPFSLIDEIFRQIMPFTLDASPPLLHFALLIA